MLRSGSQNDDQMKSEIKSRVIHENLDTSFVNLWSLLRNLSQRGFVGRVHVELEDYSADVFMTGSNTPLVHEIDRAAGTDTLEEAALHRLVLRARESPGSISVFEGADEANSVRGAGAPGPAVESDATASAEPPPAAIDESEGTIEWSEILKASGELIGSVERALTGVGADFVALFRATRLELADDYTFLDPLSNGFEYANSVVTLTHESLPDSYVAGLSEALRRVVEKVATGDRARRVRERVALELALLARRRKELWIRSGFYAQLDRIAGTKVI